MKILFAFLLSFNVFSAMAQDSWKIALDKKLVLKTSTEDDQKNVVKITAAELKKNKILEISYHDASPQKGWERTIALYDEKDKELRKQAGEKFTLQTADLKTLLDKYKTIRIYTISFPTDPKMKSEVRLRRVHLCTLVQ